jgi:hypothetical protein
MLIGPCPAAVVVAGGVVLADVEDLTADVPPCPAVDCAGCVVPGAVDGLEVVAPPRLVVDCAGCAVVGALDGLGVDAPPAAVVNCAGRVVAGAVDDRAVDVPPCPVVDRPACVVVGEAVSGGAARQVLPLPQLPVSHTHTRRLHLVPIGQGYLLLQRSPQRRELACAALSPCWEFSPP